jgi:3-(3-hydroxy-phenyl)propionate hydroxylase
MQDTGEIFDVAIVGFGPTGAVAAGLLGGYGLRTFVCDRSHEVYDKPRAIALDHEILRVFQQLGVVERVLPYAEPFTPSEFHGVEGQLIKRFTTVEPPYPLGYSPSMVFTQPPVERVLREHAQSLPGVEVALGLNLAGLTQDAEGVTLTLDKEDGSTRQVRARYLMACDGATSTVRSLVGMALEDLGFDEPWLVVDVLLNDKGLAKVPAVSMQYCEPQRPCSYIIGPGNHRRWEISINEGEDPAQLATPEGTWKLLARWLTPEDATLWRQASYRFHALVAGDWRAGCVFLAGDAAHQQPPFLGQGMCQGIRDAANLCWKLAAVLQGGADESLLDTYGTERKGHVTELTTRIKAIGQLVGQRDLVKAQQRDAKLLAECAGVVKSMPRQNVQPALVHGLLSSQASPVTGTIFPQPWIRRSTAPERMDALAGTGWRVVLSASADASLEAAASAFPAMTLVKLGTPQFEEADGVLARWFAQHDCNAAIVRPDHYVYGVAGSAQDLSVQLIAARDAHHVK